MTRIVISTIAVAAVALVACQEPAPPAQSEATPLETDGQRNSYAMGANLARQVQDSGMHLETESFIAGIQDVLRGDGSQLDDEELQTRVTGFQAQERARQQEELAATNRKISAANKEAAAAFFAENAQQEGVMTTDSGLQYKVVSAGDGERPGATDTVTVHYRGTLLDGTQFDSSYDRGEPARFPLNRVIGGWTEGLQLMPAGSKYMLYIPSHLAYGERGAGEQIGPDAALVFEVELLEIEPAAEAAAEG